MIQKIVAKEVVRGPWRAPPTWTAHLSCGHSTTRKSWEPPWAWDGFDHPELLCIECAAPSPSTSKDGGNG